MVAVAFSGGRDSLALLHATVRAARPLGLRVAALHVHHGLLPQADDWLSSAQDLCRRWRGAGWPVHLHWRHLAGGPSPGDSVEAWARRERRVALAAMAADAGATLLLLAQHRRDQAETFVLQALRGAGPRGLAAMPRTIDRGGVCWVRPWLDQPRDAIDAYIARYRLRPIEDPSNADPSYARNRLRLQVWPALKAAFGDAETALARATQRAAEADQALCELAALDLAGLVDAAGLHRAPWLLLSAARRANALRSWLGAQLPQGAAEALLQRLLAEWPSRATASWPAGEGRRLLSYRGVLRLAAPPRADGPAWAVDLSQAGRFPVSAWGGAWLVEQVAEGGIAVPALRHAEMRAREGGEQFQRAPRTPPRSLKKQYQLAAVAVDRRQGPLLWIDGQLAYVPGLGVDARQLAAPGEPQHRVSWQPDSDG